MRLADAIKARLLEIVSLDALVDGRIYELTLPQNERRASVRFDVLGKPRPTHIRGPVNQFAQRLQVDCYQPVAGSSDPISEVCAIGDAVIGDGLGREASGLFGWSGIVGGSPDTPIQILDVETVNDGDLGYEEDEQLRARLRQEYLVHWRVVTA